MRKKTGDYFILQLKRAARLLPQALFMTALLAGVALLAGWMLSQQRDADEGKEKIVIGVVGDTDDAYLSMGLFALEHTDSSRYSIRLKTMEQKKAEAELVSGKLTAYILIPEGFVEGMISGDHRPITYVTTTGAADFGTLAAEEIVSAISRLLLETENAIYGAQSFVERYIQGANPYRAGDALVRRYALAVLDRDNLFQVETIGAADYLSYSGYYLCGICVAMLLFWGTACSPLFSRRNRELCSILRSRGMGAPAQILTEFGTLWLLLAVTLLLVGLPAAAVLPRMGWKIPEWRGLASVGRLSFLMLLVPVSFLLSAQIYLLYEAVPASVEGIMTQFLNAVVQGYLAGCFYPSSFLPRGMADLGRVLPAGVSMELLKGGLTGLSPGWALWAALGWGTVCLALACALRRHTLAE